MPHCKASLFRARARHNPNATRGDVFVKNPFYSSPVPLQCQQFSQKPEALS